MLLYTFLSVDGRRQSGSIRWKSYRLPYLFEQRINELDERTMASTIDRPKREKNIQLPGQSITDKPKRHTANIWSYPVGCRRTMNDTKKERKEKLELVGLTFQLNCLHNIVRVLQPSRVLLKRMLVTFFLRTKPTSMNRNPICRPAIVSCMTGRLIYYETKRKQVDNFLTECYDGQDD